MPTKKRHTLTGKTLVNYKTQVGAFCPITGGILSGGHFVQGAFCPSPRRLHDGYWLTVVLHAVVIVVSSTEQVANEDDIATYWGLYICRARGYTRELALMLPQLRFV